MPADSPTTQTASDTNDYVPVSGGSVASNASVGVVSGTVGVADTKTPDPVLVSGPNGHAQLGSGSANASTANTDTIVVPASDASTADVLVDIRTLLNLRKFTEEEVSQINDVHEKLLANVDAKAALYASGQWAGGGTDAGIVGPLMLNRHPLAQEDDLTSLADPWFFLSTAVTSATATFMFVLSSVYIATRSNVANVKLEILAVFKNNGVDIDSKNIDWADLAKNEKLVPALAEVLNANAAAMKGDMVKTEIFGASMFMSFTYLTKLIGVSTKDSPGLNVLYNIFADAALATMFAGVTKKAGMKLPNRLFPQIATGLFGTAMGVNLASAIITDEHISNDAGKAVVMGLVTMWGGVIGSVLPPLATRFVRGVVKTVDNCCNPARTYRNWCDWLNPKQVRSDTASSTPMSNRSSRSSTHGRLPGLAGVSDAGKGTVISTTPLLNHK